MSALIRSSRMLRIFYFGIGLVGNLENWQVICLSFSISEVFLAASV